MRGDTIEPNLVQFGNISPLEEKKVYSCSVKMV